MDRVLGSFNGAAAAQLSDGPYLGRSGCQNPHVQPPEQPFPGLDLEDLIGLTPQEAVERAEAAGVDRIRLIDLGKQRGAVDAVFAPLRLDLVHKNGQIEFAQFLTYRSAGERSK